MRPVVVFAPVMGRILWGWGFAWLLLVSFATSARADKPSELGAVRVCVRPPNLEPGVGQWAYPHGKEHVVTDSEQVFREKSQGNTIYIFDPAAPPENTKLLASAQTPQQLWKIYQKVYKEYPPHWLEAIKPYFVKGK